MFQRILVPLDGSSRAERAIAVAARLARSSGGSVILLRVVNTVIEFQSSLALEPTMLQTAIDADLAEAESYLENLTVSTNLNGILTETVVLFGHVTPTILSAASSYRADIIVMCSHGYTGMTRWVMGSVAEKVVHHAPIPVFILREGGPIPAHLHPDVTQPLRVLVPLDGSAYAKAALEPAAYIIAALAAPCPGAMHLMRVAKPIPTSTREEQYEERERVLSRAKRYLSTTVEHIREGLVAPPIAELRLPVTWSVALDADVALSILRVAENGEDAEGACVFGGCDVIAIATHGRGGLQRWAMGSVTERVLRATKLPLLVVRPQEMVNKSDPTWEKATVTAP